MLKVFTAFSGYDSQCMALDRLGVDYDLVGWSEIDPHAIIAHDAVYPQYKDRNFNDITKIDWSTVPDFDLLTYSFPCQDISSAGLKAGFGKDDGTRSSLLWECEKAIRAKQPMFLLMENVSALTHKGNLPGFRLWLDTLDDCGYNTYWKKLNSKDYGVAQNRNRVYAVSIRKDIDKGYDFPEPFELIKRLGDYLEDKVDDEYVVTQARKDGLAKSNAKEESRGNGFKFVPKTLDDIANTLTTLGTSRKTDTWVERPEQGLTKLTPREYFRLMGVDEDNIDKIMSSGLKKTHLFKLGGNSIVVDTLSKVLEPLMRNYGYLEPEDNIDKVNEEFYRLFNRIM